MNVLFKCSKIKMGKQIKRVQIVHIHLLQGILPLRCADTKDGNEFADILNKIYNIIVKKSDV